MLRLACLALVAMLPLQGGEDEPSIAEELRALVAKTNALTSFHAVYRVETTVDGKTSTGSVELAYEAPDRGLFKIDMSAGKGEGRGWYAGTRMTTHFIDEDGKEAWKLLDLPVPAARSVLDAHFPPGRGSIGPGVSFIFRWPGMEDSGGQVQLQAMTSTGERGRVLQWLRYLGEHPSELRREDRRLVWSGGESTCWFSRDSGFVERAEAKSKDKNITVILDELHVDEPVGALLVLPSEASGAEVADTSGLVGSELDNVRNDAFGRVGKRLGSGELEWKHDVQDDWRNVLDAIHRERIPWRYSDWPEKMREYWAERVRSVIPEHPPEDQLADLRMKAEAARQELADKLATVEEEYVEGLRKIPAPEGEAPRDELYNVEREVIGSVFAELIADPLLDDFDERVEDAFK